MTKRTLAVVKAEPVDTPAYDVTALERLPGYWQGRADERGRDLDRVTPQVAGDYARVAAMLSACVTDPKARERMVAAERAMVAGMKGGKA